MDKGKKKKIEDIIVMTKKKWTWASPIMHRTGKRWTKRVETGN